MAANLISVDSFTTPTLVPKNGATTATIAINPKNIVSVTTKATPYNTTGVTNIAYSLDFNNQKYLINLIVTQTVAQVITLANAVSVAA